MAIDSVGTSGRLSSEEMGLILFHAGYGKIPLVSQQAFFEKNGEGWDFKIGEDSVGHFEVTECNLEGIEFQMVSWSGPAESKILMRGGVRQYILFAVIEGSCRIGWDGAGRQFHERGANMLEGVNGFIPIERQVSDRLFFFRIAFDKPSLVERTFNKKAWRFSPNLMISRVVFEALAPLIFDRSRIPEFSFVKIGLQSLIGYLFSEAPLIYQPSKIGLSSAVWFYEQKARLKSHASFAGEFSDLIERSGIENLVRFRRLLKNFYGYRIRDLLREERMFIAVKLLRDTDLLIKEVAILSGYKNIFYFTRVFSDYFHEPPGAFQKRHRK